MEGLQERLGNTEEYLGYVERRAAEYENEIQLLRIKVEAAEQDRDGAKSRAAVASAHLEKVRAKSGGLDVDRRRALRSALHRKVESLTGALRILDALYPDRVVVLPTAWRSAEESESFRKPQKAWELMLRLVEEYWEALQEGGDAVAKRVFSDATYAARESETVEASRAAKARRTFDYGGAELTMWKHLKIGVKDSVTDTFRLHFEFDDEKKRVIIGHCGKHLGFK